MERMGYERMAAKVVENRVAMKGADAKERRRLIAENHRLMCAMDARKGSR